MAITTTTHKYTTLTSDAKCILVIEKKGVYNRLSEDKIFLEVFCLRFWSLERVFQTFATRQWIQILPAHPEGPRVWHVVIAILTKSRFLGKSEGARHCQADFITE